VGEEVAAALVVGAAALEVEPAVGVEVAAAKVGGAAGSDEHAEVEGRWSGAGVVAAGEDGGTAGLAISGPVGATDGGGGKNVERSRAEGHGAGDGQFARG